METSGVQLQMRCSGNAPAPEKVLFEQRPERDEGGGHMQGN